MIDMIIQKLREARTWMDKPSSGAMEATLRGAAGKSKNLIQTIAPYTGVIPAIFYLGAEKNASSGNTAFARTQSAARAQEITAARGRVNGLQATSGYFNALSKSFGAEGFSTGKQIEGFDKRLNALSTAEGVPEGAAIANQAREMLRPYLAAGDTENARKGLEGLAREIGAIADAQRDAAATKSAAYAADTTEKLTMAQKKLQDLNAQLAAASDQGAQKRIQQDLADTSSDVKELTDNLSTLNEEFQKQNQTAFTDDMLAKVKEFAEEVKVASKSYGEMLSSFGNTGFANLDATLAAGGAALERNMLRQIIDESRAKNAILDEQDNATLARLSTSPRGLVQDSVDRINERKDRRNLAVSALEENLLALNDPTDAALREVEAKRQADLIRTSYADSRRSTGSSFGSFDVGLTEGERLGNRGRGILGQLSADIANPKLGSGNAASDARELGAITERMVQAKETQFSMEDRLNRAIAERLNLDKQITEENRRQSEEAAKRLAMASREDQLRAAGASAFLRSRGRDQFSMGEFQFFSQESRGAIGNLMPRSVKGLDDSEQDQQRRRSDLDGEIQGIAVSLRGLRETLNQVLPQAEKKAGGIIDVDKPFGTKAPDTNRISDLDANAIRMNLNTGPINVNLDFSSHVNDILRVLQGRMDGQLSSIHQDLIMRLQFQREPDLSGVSGTF